MPTKSIKIESPVRKIALLVMGVICLAAVWFFVKWFFAETIATQRVVKEVAVFAAEAAPDDPQTHLASAILLEKTFLPDDLPKSLEEYEKTVALSPNDYRLWFELARARDRQGEAEKAEAAFRQALRLAPNYSPVQWTFGNFLLRQGKSEEAFTQIRRAADSNNIYANPTITTAWQIFEGDADKIEQYIGDSANLKASFAALLAREKRFQESLKVWDSLPENDRRTIFKANGEDIYNKMLEAKKYRTALQLFSQFASSDEKKFALGEINNGDFEGDVRIQGAGVFEWQIGDGIEPQIGFDNSQKHGGSKSLVMLYRVADSKAFRNISQTVAVASEKRYIFEMFYKSELKTAATFKWEAVDVAAGRILASTEAMTPNTDWASLKMEFVSPPDAEAVIFRLARANCNLTLCPVSGTVWFDDFNLKSQ